MSNKLKQQEHATNKASVNHCEEGNTDVLQTQWVKCAQPLFVPHLVIVRCQEARDERLVSREQVFEGCECVAGNLKVGHLHLLEELRK